MTKFIYAFEDDIAAMQAEVERLRALLQEAMALLNQHAGIVLDQSGNGFHMLRGHDGTGLGGMKAENERLRDLLAAGVERERALLKGSHDERMASALNYVADMTFCGADAEWHFKSGYDPQRVLDALPKEG